MTTYNHIHLPCCDNSCVLITSEITASGTQTTIHPSSQICETLFGQPNTCWTVYPIKSIPRSTEGKSCVRPPVSLLKGRVDPHREEVEQTKPLEKPEIKTARTVATQTDPVVLLDTGVGRPPALFSTSRVGPFHRHLPVLLFYLYLFSSFFFCCFVSVCVK